MPFTSEDALALMAEETARGWRNPQLMQQFADFVRGINPQIYPENPKIKNR